MDVDAVRAAYDEQVRRAGAPAGPGVAIERDAHVTRRVGPPGSWTGVTWSGLEGADARAVVAGEIARFVPVGRPWEWKLYAHDGPADLPEVLVGLGFVPGPEETVLVAETDALATVAVPVGLDVSVVADRRGVADLVAVQDAAFGGGSAAMGDALLAEIEAGGRTTAAVVGAADGSPVAAGRVEFCAGTAFAGLWGGCTAPGWRGRGAFRALVAHRAALARERGFRYLQVDANPDSRPILERLGFVRVSSTTPYRHPGGAG